MTKQEKKDLEKLVVTAVEVGDILSCEVTSKEDVPKPTLKSLLDLLRSVRIAARYRMLDLEATERENAQGRNGGKS